MARSQAVVTAQSGITPSPGNPVINGAFDIWQRGTSVAIASNGSATYTADRWFNARNATGQTVSRQATGDTTNLPNIQYCARVQRDSGSTNTTEIRICNPFESVNSIPLAGKTVTLSFYARSGANFSATSSSFTGQLVTGTGTDQNLLTSGYTGGAYPISTAVTLTTTWQRFTATGTIASTATELSLNFYFTPTGTAGAADYVEITGVQIDVGSVALPFRRAGGTIQGELAACQRYYWRTTATDNATPIANGMNVSTTAGMFFVQFPVQMRVQPTSIDYSALQISDFSAYGTDVTGIVFESPGNGVRGTMIRGTGGSGFTTNQPSFLRLKTNATSYFGLSSEL
jgi:hypothetical protein